jgi:hypothetical protein
MRVPPITSLIAVMLLLTGCASKMELIDREGTFVPPERVKLSEYRSVQDRRDQDPKLLLTVAISGGGARAANYAAGVFEALEIMEYHGHNLMDEIDYFSTVSGGGLAAAAYETERYAYLRTHDGSSSGFSFTAALRERCDSPNKTVARNQCLLNNLNHNYHHQLESRFYDLEVIFSELTSGDVLENEFDDRLTGRSKYPQLFGDTSFSLKHIFEPATSTKPPSLPYLVANATIFQNGSILPFTPDVLRRYGVDEYYHRRSTVHFSEDQLGNFAVAAAVKASASFPTLIPNTVLKAGRSGVDNAHILLADGGLSDNLGLFTAVDLMCGDVDLRPSSTHRVLLVVDAFPGLGSPYSTRTHSALPVTMAVKASGISMDSWRGRHRAIIGPLAERCGAKIIYLSFDELSKNATDGTPAAPACEWARHELEPLTKDGIDRIHQRARTEDTRLQVSEENQANLIKAGRLVVALHCDAIARAVTDQ